MPPLFNILVCILAVLIGFVLGRWYREWRSHHDLAGKHVDSKIDMTKYKNLNALKEKRQARLHRKEVEKARKNGTHGSITAAAGSKPEKK